MRVQTSHIHQDGLRRTFCLRNVEIFAPGVGEAMAMAMVRARTRGRVGDKDWGRTRTKTRE